MRNHGQKIDDTAPLSSGLLPAEEDNARMSEMKNSVTTAGISLDPGNGPDSDLTMMAQAMARYASGGIVYTDEGAANAPVLASVGGFIVPKGYFDGMRVIFRPSATNTGPATVNVNGLGIKSIRASDGTDLVGGELIEGGLTDLVYDATSGRFRLGLTGTGTRTIVPGDYTTVETVGPETSINGALIEGDAAAISVAYTLETNTFAVSARLASETETGVVELATAAEAVEGTATDKAVTPEGLEARIDDIPTATTEVQGIVELATVEEATTGTDTERAVTPAGLKAGLDTIVTGVPDATTETKGKVELATVAEVVAGEDNERAVTPAGLFATRSIEPQFFIGLM